MGKKKRLKAIKAIANALPLINEQTSEKHFYKGSEILSWNTITEIDGVPIDPEKTYEYDLPVFMIQNNRRRVKRAFLRNGPEGIGKYLASINKVRESNYVK